MVTQNHIWQQVSHWLRAMMRRGKVERELDAELCYDLERRTEAKVRSGMTPGEARRSALRAFGGVDLTKEECRDARGTQFLDQLWQDIRFGLRLLRKNPGFTAVAILTLALGIGANTAIFSLLDAAILRPLPVPHASQLMLMKWTSQQKATWKEYEGSGSCEEDFDLSGLRGCAFSYAAFDEFRSRSQSLAGIAAISSDERVHVSLYVNAEHVPLSADYVSGDFFATMQVTPHLGRLLMKEDDRLGANPVAVISYNFWQQNFGSNPGAVGRFIYIEDTPFTVVGVAPGGFPGIDALHPANLWIPIHASALLKRKTMWTNPDTPTPWLAVIARLKPHESLDRAQAELTQLYRAAMTDYPARPFPVDATPGIILTDFSHGEPSGFRTRFSQPLFILMVIVGCVLLIACANIASLNLARGSARRGEIVVRFALGASRVRLLRQLLTESLLLAIGGAAAGLLLATWLARSLAAFVGSGLSTPVFLDVRLSPLVFAFTAVVATFAALLFGLMPAILASRVEPLSAMKVSGGVGGHGLHSLRGSTLGKMPLGRLLVTCQVAVALILAVGAGLFLRTLINLEFLDTGFDKGHVLVFSASLTSDTDSEGPQMTALNTALRARLLALPGVTSVSWANAVFLDGGYGTNRVEMDHNGREEDLPVRWMAVGPGIFQTLGIKMLAGRDVEINDLRKDSDAVWINNSLAKLLFPGEDPVGKQVRLGELKTVVGVVADTKYESMRGEMLPAIYNTYAFDIPGYNFLIRTAGDPGLLVPAVRNVFHELAPQETVHSVSTELQMMNQQLFYERLMARLSGAFGSLALLLTCIGVYGVLVYSVSRRTGEIAIRMALGAMPWDILRLVVGEGLRPVVVGGVLGLFGAYALTHLVAQFLFGIRPLDPLTFIVASLLLLTVAAVACWIPARRATRVDPMTALRHE
ncbi:MAG TPA: ABC transporter permease [Candidatus Limnocylindrales bacterium]|nr:ABC transporter permease [Candidatus Limnocylindrales bacterium]